VHDEFVGAVMSSEAVAGNAPRVGAGLLTSMRLSFEEATPREFKRWSKQPVWWTHVISSC